MGELDARGRAGLVDGVGEAAQRRDGGVVHDDLPRVRRGKAFEESCPGTGRVEAAHTLQALAHRLDAQGCELLRIGRVDGAELDAAFGIELAWMGC